MIGVWVLTIYSVPESALVLLNRYKFKKRKIGYSRVFDPRIPSSITDLKIILDFCDRNGAETRLTKIDNPNTIRNSSFYHPRKRAPNTPTPNT